MFKKRPWLSNNFLKCMFLAGLLTILVSCNHPDDFDPLSMFPSNSESLAIGEVNLVAVAKENVTAEATTFVPDSDREVKSKEIVVQEGVRAERFRNGRSAPSSTKKFTRLDSVKTGITANLFREFTAANADKSGSPFTGNGIAIGDLDGDGLADLFVASQINGGRLFRNLGDLRFKDVTEAVGITIDSMWGTSPTLVDINNDGLLDIFLCGYDSPNRLFINRGRKFVDHTKRYGLNFRGACVASSFVDYDRDGDLDLFLVTNRLTPKQKPGKLPVERPPGKPPRIKEEFREQNRLIQIHDGSYVPVKSGQYDYLFRNDNQEFVDVTAESQIGTNPYLGMSATWCDINSDMWPDLYIANDRKDPDQLFRNDGPNQHDIVTFTDVTQQILSRHPWFSKGVDVSDINNDGGVDILVGGNMGSDHVAQVTSQGNLSGDKSDEWFLNWSNPTQHFGNAINMNLNGQKMLDISYMTGLVNTDWTWSIRARDFDNDGLLDLAVGNGQIRSFLDNDLNRELRENPGDDTASSDRFWLNKQTSPSENEIFRNLGNLDFENVSQTWGFCRNDVTQAVACADLDNDGDIDIVTCGYQEPIQIYRNDISSSNAIRVRLYGLQSNVYGVGAIVTLTVEGRDDTQTRQTFPSGGFMSCDEPIIHFGLGTAATASKLEIKWPSGSTQTIKQIEANYLYHVKESKSAGFVSSGLKFASENKLFSKDTAILAAVENEELFYDDFNRQPLMPFQHSQIGPGIAWGDIDNDGDYDLYVGGAAFEHATLLRNDGHSKFKKTQLQCFKHDSRCEDLGSVFFDADSDGDLDLYVVSGGVESTIGDPAMQDRLYINDGSGGFEKSNRLIPDMSFSGCSVSVADFDSDGNLDLFVGGRINPGEYPRGPQSALLRNTGNGFENVTEQFAPSLLDAGLVTSSLWCDVNEDDFPDLMLCTEWGPVKCFQNIGGQRLKEVTGPSGLASRSGFHNSICTGDVDNDGDIDFFIGNLGANTEYQATAENPVGAYYGKFTAGSSSQFIETISIDGNIYPRRSLDLLLNQLPFLGNKFASNKEFASAEITDVFDKTSLFNALSLQVNSTDSGILINESNGDSIRFAFKPTPLLTQTSPVYGCQLCDFDGDGFLDLYLLQNNYGVNPRIERFCSGIGMLLKGNGTGTFSPILPKESGLVVDADATALAAVDLNNDARVDFVAATNDDGLSVFSNRSRHAPFAIDVARLSGGKNYVGAKVVIEFADHSRQLHQICTSDGYLSQSPPIVYSGLATNSKIEKISVRWPDGTTRSGTIRNLFYK